MQPKENVNPVAFDHESEQVFFSDIAEVNISDENVSISFAIKSRDGKSATVSHVVYLTIPHFIRLADVCGEMKNTFITELAKRAEEFKKLQSSQEKK